MAEFQGVLCPCTLGLSSLRKHMAATAAAAAAAVAMPAGDPAAAASGTRMRRPARCCRPVASTICLGSWVRLLLLLRGWEAAKAMWCEARQQACRNLNCAGQTSMSDG